MLELLLTLIISVPALWFVARYNLHMLQLNGYINKEHWVWLNDNLNKQWILIAISAIGIVNIIFCNVILITIQCLFTILTFFVYKLMKEMYAKKPLHFTARSIRILASDFILVALFVLLVYVWVGDKRSCAALGIALGLQVALVPLANFVNKPIEALIRNFYISQAKAILKKCENLKVIGITGSFGKTSFKFFLSELLSAKFSVLTTPESYNTPMGIVKTIRENLDASHEIFVCEMGARYVGEIKEICEIVNPDYGVITSVGPAHLMTFGSLDNIAKTKFELADSIPKNARLFLNANSEAEMSQLKKRKAEGIYDNVCTYSASVDVPATFSSRITNVDCEGTDFLVKQESFGEQAFHTRLVGVHNVINLTGAIAVATEFGVDPKQLAVQVRRIKAVPHRMELKKNGDVTVIDDAFNSNPVGSTSALETLSMFEGVKILVTPGMVELGQDEEKYNFELGTCASKCCDWIVLVGKTHTLPIKNGALKSGFDASKVKVYDTFEEAINFAYKIDRNGRQAYILLENDLPDNYS